MEKTVALLDVVDFLLILGAPKEGVGANTLVVEPLLALANQPFLPECADVLSNFDGLKLRDYRIPDAILS